MSPPSRARRKLTYELPLIGGEPANGRGLGMAALESRDKSPAISRSSLARCSIRSVLLVAGERVAYLTLEAEVLAAEFLGAVMDVAAGGVR